MSGHRRRGGDEFTGQRAWTEGEQAEVYPWPEEPGPAGAPGQQPGGDRPPGQVWRGRHSASPAGPRGGREPEPGPSLPRQARPPEPQGPPGWPSGGRAERYGPQPPAPGAPRYPDPPGAPAGPGGRYRADPPTASPRHRPPAAGPYGDGYPSPAAPGEHGASRERPSGRPGPSGPYPAAGPRAGPRDSYPPPPGQPGRRAEPRDRPAGTPGRPPREGYEARYGPGARDGYPAGHGSPDDGGWLPGDGGGRRPRRRGRWAGPTAALVVALIIGVPLAIGGFFAYRIIESHYNPPNYSGDGTGQIVFQVKPGDSATTVGERLVTAGVVASDRAFVLAAEHSANANALEPGFYRLHLHMNATLAWDLLLNPAARVQVKVTIPEGWRVSQILAVLGKQSGIPASDYAKAIKDPGALGLPSYAHGNPEGYLFPATYEIQPNMTATSVLRAMVSAYNTEAAAVSLPQAAAHVHLTPAQIITVASLAQAEGGSDADFPKIAQVIYNRLAAGMPLDLDSTVLFALNTYGILASDAQLQVNSPYNTYTHKGLPPGPIDSPGNAAIQAALHPASGNWLYFVTVNPKTRQTVFTNSETVFNQLKAELEHNLARGG